MTTRSGIVALLTDFGLRDPYVGVMKGVILGLHPAVRLVDLTHDVDPQDVLGASVHLSGAYRYFPPGTVFVAVVDPGVGGARALLAVEADDRLFLAPDNGLLTFLRESGRATRTVRVENESIFLKPVSNTFHGRDIFAPAAAHLARGGDLAELGPITEPAVTLSWPKVRQDSKGKLVGEVVLIDRFGTLITNVPADRIPSGARLRVRAGRGTARGLSRTYGEGKKGTLLALIGSTGHLELSVNQGDARKKTGARRGSRVVLLID